MKTKIRIGHPAYSGANRGTLAMSKAAAVRELRARGAKRDVARDAVNDVCTRISGHTCITVDHSLIEVLHWSGIVGTTAFDTGSGVQEFVPPKVTVEERRRKFAIDHFKGIAKLALADPFRKGQWTKMGHFYGYPECCVNQFTTDCCAETKATYPSGPWRLTGYVPCMDCASKAIGDFDKFVAEAIIPNRESNLAFGPSA